MAKYESLNGYAQPMLCVMSYVNHFVGTIIKCDLNLWLKSCITQNSLEKKKDPTQSRTNAPTISWFKEKLRFSSFLTGRLNSSSSSSSSSSSELRFNTMVGCTCLNLRPSPSAEVPAGSSAPRDSKWYRRK